MKKRVLSFVCALCLICALLPITAFAVWTTPTLQVAANYESGQVKATVTIGAHTDLGAINFTLSYDSTKLTINGTPTGKGFNSSAVIGTATPGKIISTWDKIEGTTSAGPVEILSVTFDVIDGQTGNAAFSIYSISMNDISGDNEVTEAGPGSVLSDSVTITTPHAHVYDQTNTDDSHLKTPATCTSPAVYYKSCTCGENGTETFTSGSALGHDYTQKFEDDAHLKTAASKCTEHNIYWFDCSRCDSNAKNDPEAADKYFTSSTTGSHSFTQQIEDAAHHVAGTGTDCQSVKQYYYDCAYCDQTGTTTWDSTTYGPHNYATTWSSDALGHWHACSLCPDKKDNAAHTPDHTGHATEEYAIKCTECGYVIEAQLGHTHVFDKEVTTDAYKASDATCTAKATYYKSCACGEKGTATFEYGGLGAHNWTPATCTAPKTCSVCQATEGDPLGHTEGTEWKYDSDNHWHTCTVAGCGVVIDSSKDEHRPSPTLKYDNTSHWHVCAVCGAETDEHQEHQFDGGKTCVNCGYTKGSTIVILDPVDTEKPDLENPGTGATVSGSGIGYACAALAAVSAIYVGAKKLAKKDEE